MIDFSRSYPADVKMDFSVLNKITKPRDLPLSCSLDADTKAKFDAIALELGVTKSSLTALAVYNLIDEYNKHQERVSG